MRSDVDNFFSFIWELSTGSTDGTLDRFGRLPVVCKPRVKWESPTLPNNQFSILADKTQLSVSELARLLRVRDDSVLKWCKGKRTAPDGVLRELREYLGTGTNA